MKIAKVKLSKKTRGLPAFDINNLGDVVILAGKNGSGKTRLLKLMEMYINSLIDSSNVPVDSEEPVELGIIVAKNGQLSILASDNVHELKLINFSHYDAQLQLPNSFPPYVISKAKEHLEDFNVESSFLNTLLYIEDITKGYSAEFENGYEFNNFANDLLDVFELKLSYGEDKAPMINGRRLVEANLSPGQQYLLRMAVAIHCNQGEGEFVLFLDEPETHLHPKVLIALIEKLRLRFKGIQLWIATHSLPLTAFYSSRTDCLCSIYHLGDKIKPLGSNSADLISGLLGDDLNRFRLEQLIVSPDAFACIKFAVECGESPEASASKPKDKQIEFAKTDIQHGDIVIDFGAGQGRFLEGLFMDYPELIPNIQYYAYDISSRYSEQCKYVMSINGISSDNYYNDFGKLFDKIGGRADVVFLINVLHEIDPEYWADIYQNICKLLKESGKLVVVELEELTYGERPYDNGFIILTERCAKAIIPGFCCGFSQLQLEGSRERYISKFVFTKSMISKIKYDDVISGISELNTESLEKIQNIKSLQASKENDDKYYLGIKLAFWTHQYANTALVMATREGAG